MLIIVDISAKSIFISPTVFNKSVIPTIPCFKVLSACLNASTIVTLSEFIFNNFSFSITLLIVLEDEDIYVYFFMTDLEILFLVRQFGTMYKALEEMPEVELRFSDGGM